MKLSPVTVYVLGVSVSVVILSYGFFWQFMPNTQEAKMLEQNFEELKTVASQINKAEKKVDDAIKLASSQTATWRSIAATRTPPANVAQGGINLNVNAWQLAVDTKKFRNNIQRAVNRQVKAGGVTVVNGPLVPQVPDDVSATGLLTQYYNLGTAQFNFPIVIFNLGQVTVTGTYSEIMNNVRSWSNMPNYLAVADGLALTGTAPELTGTYNLTIVGFIRGKQFFPPVPESAGAATTGGGGGFPGGPPTGFGGPPTGFPGAPGGGIPGGGRPGPAGAAAGGGGGRG